METEVRPEAGFVDLRGRVALVTGGAAGLGSGIASVLRACGAVVAIADLRTENTDAFAAAVGGRADACAFQVDIAIRTEVEQMVSRVLDTFGRIDILVNNAGVHGAPGIAESGIEFREEDWDATFAVNVKGTVLVTEAVAPGMMERRSGKIVNIASQAGRGEWPSGGGILAAESGGAYGASKAAVIQLTQTYANKLGPYNINVNSICPGSIYTRLWQEHGQWAAKFHPAYKGLEPEEVYARSIKERAPLGRAQTADDVGNAVAFLVSDQASNITGQALNVNGGQRFN